MEKEQKRVAKYNPEADKKWAEQNKVRRNYLSSRGTARSFIRNKAALEDLDELEQLIAERRKEL